MENVKIMVVTHKLFDDSILPKGYQVIKVGNEITEKEAKHKGYLTDSIEDNIAHQNPWYCELTAHYWAWKNLDCDICGLVHYRRYFMKNSLFARSFKDDIMPEEKIIRILKKHKLIVPYMRVKPNDTMTLHKGMPKEQDNRDWIILESIISSDYPELMESFNKIVYGTEAWGKNMIITTKDIFDEYSSFLFDVLGKWDKELGRRGISRRSRVDGFYSETLMPIWVMAKFKEKDLYRTDVRNSESECDAYEYYSNSWKAFLKRSLKSIHWLNNRIKQESRKRNYVKVEDLPHSPID